ncbi:SUKH-4 family immunity protein [Streptomyces sp. NPDC046853]|uniref:SUKH-4 family immunity protein n=1 Tax=Streptomyces sp. NPDC046853 TaxID=3154920 RepID=UPI0033DCB8C1
MAYRTLTADQLVSVHGLAGVVYYPQPPRSLFDTATANFLSSAGLPGNRLFAARADVGVEEDDVDPVELGPLFDLDGLEYPAERRHWYTLGYLRTTLVVLDPVTGAVHGYIEGDDDSIVLHRDVESFAFCLTELRRLQDAGERGEGCAEVAARFREAVNGFDALPLDCEESEWSVMLDEFASGMW